MRPRYGAQLPCTRLASPKTEIDARPAQWQPVNRPPPRRQGVRPQSLAVRALRALAGFAKGLKVSYADIEVGLDYEGEAGLADNGDLEHDQQELLESAGAAAKAAGTALVIFVDEL